jgi:hypothetical protein
MRGLARFFGEDEEAWGLCGLMHDIDVEQITPKEQYEQHMREHCGETCIRLLKEIGFPDEWILTVRSHNEYQNLPRNTRMAKALFAVDGLTGFIMAVGKIMPDKSIRSVKVKSVLKRLKEKRFAAAVNREHIRSCEKELGISLEQFVEITLHSMQKIAEELEENSSQEATK